MKSTVEWKYQTMQQRKFNTCCESKLIIYPYMGTPQKGFRCTTINVLWHASVETTINWVVLPQKYKQLPVNNTLEKTKEVFFICLSCRLNYPLRFIAGFAVIITICVTRQNSVHNLHVRVGLGLFISLHSGVKLLSLNDFVHVPSW